MTLLSEQALKATQQCCKLHNNSMASLLLLHQPCLPGQHDH